MNETNAWEDYKDVMTQIPTSESGNKRKTTCSIYLENILIIS